RVGTGKDIKIEDDVWVPEAEGIKIKQTISKPNIIRVTDLIDSDTRSWRVGLVLSTFADSDARKILRIPLAKFPYDDFMVWRGELMGEFMVCSGYKLLLQGN
ncbi:hypothetical protein Godav_022314, partial [Gossypium davidsonii]|nr:hypothetical protein [Gossypium davidsonii]